jgi:hypothetical protein
MYNYNLNMEENKLVVTKNGENLCEAEIRIEEDVAKLDFISLNDIHLSFVSELCTKVREILSSNEVQVKKVVFGGILAVAHYDEYLGLADPSLNTNPVIVLNKR